MSRSIWRELAISPSTDEREIRRAYARRLKIVQPEDDPQGFQALRAAFEQAMNHARHAAWEADNGWNEDDAVDEGLDASAAPAGENHAPPPAKPLTGASPQDPALIAEMARDRADRDEHQRRCDALSEALRQPAPDGDAVLTALVAVFRSPALGALDVHESTEHWLGQLTGQRGPGFDALLEPAIAFFGWDHRPVGDHWNPGLAALQHREDVETIRRLRNPDSPAHDSYMALSRPVGWRMRLDARLKPELGRRIADLLARIDQEAPYVLGYLNADSVAWWRTYLSRPRLGATSCWFIIAITLLAGFYAASEAPAGAGGVRFMTGLAAGLISSTLLALAAHHLLVLPRWKRLNDISREPGFWIRSGWVPASAALILIASFISTDLSAAAAPVVQAIFGLTGLAIAAWAVVMVDDDPWSQRLTRLWAWAPLFLPLWFISGFATADRHALQLTIMTGLLAFAAGGLYLNRRWPADDQGHKRSGALLAIAATIGAVLADQSQSFPVLAGPALAVLLLSATAAVVAGPRQASGLVLVRSWLVPLAVFFIALIAEDAPPPYNRNLFAWGGLWFGGLLALTTLCDVLGLGHNPFSRKRRKSVDRFA